jgi:hypothetical protein
VYCGQAFLHLSIIKCESYPSPQVMQRLLFFAFAKFVANMGKIKTLIKNQQYKGKTKDLASHPKHH